MFEIPELYGWLFGVIIMRHFLRKILGEGFFQGWDVRMLQWLREWWDAPQNELLARVDKYMDGRDG